MGFFISVILRQYWKYVGYRVMKWLEELFETKVEDKQTIAQTQNRSGNE